MAGVRLPITTHRLHAADVLAHLCALHFSDRTFPDHHAAQTSLAKVAAYVWAVMADIIRTAAQ